MNPAPNSQTTEPETIETVEIPPAAPNPEEPQPIDLAQSFTARRFRNIVCHPSDKTKPFGQQMQKIAADLLRRFKPRDPVEEMLIAQMVWTHARVANLSTLFSAQHDIKWHGLMALQADRAANLFRRQMLALADYRRPTRRSFTAIRQANIAEQQVVNSRGDTDAIEEEEKAEISIDPAKPNSPPTRSLQE
jgi:hypothetical protein